MLEHVLNLIESAERSPQPLGINGPQEPATRLAAEAIRLARLAASTHMILSARMPVWTDAQNAEPAAGEEQ